MRRVPTSAARPELPLFALGVGAFGHAIAWSLYFLLAVADTSAGVPAWAQLAIHFGGREAILIVFSLAAMLPLMAGVQEVMGAGRPRLARVLGLLCAAIALALAWRWYEQGRVVLPIVAVLLALLTQPSPPRAAPAGSPRDSLAPPPTADAPARDP